nr:MAG TPA: hypothetical protein [Caudoviricetes sp.]
MPAKIKNRPLTSQHMLPAHELVLDVSPRLIEVIRDRIRDDFVVGDGRDPIQIPQRSLSQNAPNESREVLLLHCSYSSERPVILIGKNLNLNFLTRFQRDWQFLRFWFPALHRILTLDNFHISVFFSGLFLFSHFYVLSKSCEQKSWCAHFTCRKICE